GVPKGTGRKGGVEDPAIRGADIPAETAAGGISREGLGLPHGRHRLLAENPLAPALAAVQEHLNEDGQVVGGGKDPGMPGHPAHPISSGVLHFTPAQAAGLYVAGGNLLLLALRRPEGGVLEAQGPKDLLGAVYIQRLPRDPMHYLAQGDKVDV